MEDNYKTNQILFYRVLRKINCDVLEQIKYKNGPVLSDQNSIMEQSRDYLMELREELQVAKMVG